MTTSTLTRRDLLGGAAKAIATFAALSGPAAFNSSLAATSGAGECIATHRQLALNLKNLLHDRQVSQSDKAHALKTCRCAQCNVAITPML